MSKIMPLLLAAILSVCGKSEPTTLAEPLTVEALVSTPGRLKELRKQCKTDRAAWGDELCNRVAEATNRRFFGNRKVPYTPSKESSKL
ncbi:entry exclusion lipoprotein TrbK [Burkholderia pseudomallei]|uniref:entry exclusion lipoprotein TrbK n=1 Tax=Burkholderia pseudomallei TaxID=28450 RepID=UPI000E6A1335|nr:entry exclusion lipoprotein TrbK [Burkholderia pseudomallei]RIV48305.1 entry exclusion lipoprotein TrbK [Burkholderia pseudomallei]RIV63732.1 entry exclusion lipoprotein TrbK [Burkholderia pseudomallei]